MSISNPQFGDGELCQKEDETQPNKVLPPQIVAYPNISAKIC